MTESRTLLTAAAALLVLALGLHWPALTRRVPRGAWWLAGAGALMPLLDPLASHLAEEDRIAALTHMPLFGGPLPGLGVVALSALAVAIWRGARPAGWVLGAAGGGLALHMGLLALTPWGVPWLAPFSADRVGWPLFPAGQPVGVLLLAASVALLELLPRWRRLLGWGTVGSFTLYAALAAAGQTWAAYHAPPAPPQVGRSIEPDGLLPDRWLVIDRLSGAYQVQRWRLGAAQAESPARVARWNDEPLFLLQLEDPVVFRIFTRMFLHPVAELARSGSQTTLTVQELADGAAGMPGPTFVLKAELDGRNRLYRLERFD